MGHQSFGVDGRGDGEVLGRTVDACARQVLRRRGQIVIEGPVRGLARLSGQ